MDAEKQSKIFFGRMARYYDFVFGNLMRKMQMRIAKFAKIKGNSRVLDAGCGTGNFLIVLEKYNLELYGIDITKEMLEIAKHKLKRAKLKLVSAEKLNFKDNYFNYVFSIDAFHHYSNKERALGNFYRILKKNGKLIIVDVNFGRFLNKIFQKLEPGNNGVLTKHEMRDIFKRYKFRKIEQRKAGAFTEMTTGIK